MNHSSFPASVQVDGNSPSSGQLCLAQQGKLGRSVMVKQARDPQHAQQLAHEARLQALLEHPGVAVLHGAGDGWLLVQRIQGTTIDQIPAHDLAHGRLTEIAIAVAQTFLFAHDVGVIHGPLQTSEVMSGAYGEVAIQQWGSAQTLGSRVDHSRLTDSLPLPPEWVEEAENTAQPTADVFCFGYWLLSLLDILTDLESHDRLRAFAQQCCDHNPQQRPTMHTVLAHIRNYRDTMAARERAQQRLSELQHQAQGVRQGIATSQATQWRDWNTIANAAEQILLLDPDGPARHLRNEACTHLFHLALDNGDLHSAQHYAQALGPYPGPDRLALVKDARKRQQQRLQRLRWWKGAGVSVAALLACALVAIPVLGWFEWQQSRAERQAEAQRLLQQVTATIAESDHPEQLITAQALATQALGLAVEQEPSREVLRRSALALIAWAQSEGSLRLANEQLALAQEYGLSNEAAQPLQQQIADMRVAEAQHSLQRQQHWTTTVETWMEHAEHMDERQLARAAVRWASWRPENDAEERLLVGQLQAALLSPQPGPRQLASDVMRIGHRGFTESNLYPIEALLPSALDPDPQLREPAIAALAAIRPQHLYEELIEGLVSLRRDGIPVRHRVLDDWVNSREDRHDDDPAAMRQRRERLSVAAYTDMNLQVQLSSNERNRLFAELGQARFHSDWEKIERLTRQILADTSRPFNTYAAHKLIKSLGVLNKHEEAFTLAQGFQQEHPNNRQLDIAFAAAALRVGRNEEAEEALERGFQYTINDGFLQYGMRSTLIWALQASERADDAITVMQAQGDLGDDMWAHLAYVETLLEAGLVNESLAKSYEITSRWPGFHFAYANRTDIYLALGLLPEAEQAAEMAISIMPRNPAILASHGRAMAALNRFEHAAARYLMGDALRPGRDFTRFNGMLNARRAGADDTALSIAESLRSHSNSFYRRITQILAFYACLEHNALPAALDILENYIEEEFSASSSLLSRLELAIPELRDHGHSWLKPERAATFTLLEIETLLQGDEEQRASRQAERQALFARYAQLRDQQEEWPENITLLHHILDQMDNNPEAVDVAALLQKIPEEGWISSRIHFHLQQVENGMWPLLPLAISPETIPRHPLPQDGLGIDQESIDRLTALQSHIHTLLADDAGEDPAGPIAHLLPRGEVNAERELKTLGSGHGRIDRGWDFPPQVWRDRRERQQQESQD